MPAMHTEILTSAAELQQVFPAWDALIRANPSAEIFQTSAWARTWLDAFGADVEICTPVVLDKAGTILAIWPLAVRNGTLIAIGDRVSDCNEIVTSSENAASALPPLFDAVFRSHLDWNRGLITNVSERGVGWSSFRQVVESAPDRALLVRSATGFSAVASAGPEYFNQLAKKESLRRHRKKLARVGELNFRHLATRCEILRHLPTMQRQHETRWRLAGVPSTFASVSQFYGLLPSYLSPEGPLRFAVLEAGGVPVAYHMGFEFGGKLVWYKPTFDIDLAECGPGEVMLQSVLEYAAARRLHEVDFTIGQEAYKNRFANVQYGYYTAHLFRRSRHKLYLLQAREALKEHSPALFNQAKAVAGLTSSFHRSLVRAVRREGVFGFAHKKLAQLVHSVVWRNDTVLVFRHSGLHDNTTPDWLHIEPMTMSAVSEAMVNEDSGYLAFSRIGRLTDRVRGGDRAVMAMVSGEVAHLAWVGSRQEIRAGYETGQKAVITLSKQVSVIYDCWTTAKFRGKGIYPIVLRQLVLQETERGHETWIYCLEDNLASRAGIQKAGFVLVGKLKRKKLLWFEWPSATLTQPDAAQ